MRKSCTFKFAGFAGLALTVGVVAHLGAARADSDPCLERNLILEGPALKARMQQADQALSELRQQIGADFLPAMAGFADRTAPSSGLAGLLSRKSFVEAPGAYDLVLEEDKSFGTAVAGFLGTDKEIYRMDGKNYRLAKDVSMPPPVEVQAAQADPSPEAASAAHLMALQRKGLGSEFIRKSAEWSALARRFGLSAAKNYDEDFETEQKRATARYAMELFHDVQTQEEREGLEAENKALGQKLRRRSTAVVVRESLAQAQALLEQLPEDEVVDVAENGLIRDTLKATRASTLKFIESADPITQHYYCVWFEAKKKADEEAEAKRKKEEAELQAAPALGPVAPQADALKKASQPKIVPPLAPTEGPEASEPWEAGDWIQPQD